MFRYFKYRLYPDAEQRVLLAKHFGCARFVYNYALSLKIKAWKEEKKQLSQFDLCKEVSKLRNQEETIWLREVCCHMLQKEMEFLIRAFDRLFREKNGFPKFKNRNDKRSYTTDVNIEVFWRSIRLPKLGLLKAAIDRQARGKIKRATVTQTPTGKYFVSILCELSDVLPEKMPITEEGTIGIDLGIKHFVTLSTGEKVENPRPLKKRIKRLQRAQRKLSRRKKGSANRQKQRRIVARIHEKISDTRKDFLHKLSTRLVNENQVDTLAIENLAVKNMMKNHCLAGAISDSGWGTFKSFLIHKAERVGKNVIVIGRFEPSSKMCSCGQINDELKLSDRVWTCRHCYQTHDRDILAAMNIKKFALRNYSLREAIPEFTPVEISDRRSLKQEVINSN